MVTGAARGGGDRQGGVSGPDRAVVLPDSTRTCGNHRGVTVGEPSAFWRQLGADHASSLASHGFDDIKRRQALRYFTWQWRWRHVGRSEQLRFLLRESSPLSIASALWRPGPLDSQTWVGPSWSRLDRRLYIFATRLLWACAART